MNTIGVVCVAAFAADAIAGVPITRQEQQERSFKATLVLLAPPV
jgi:hypothetical protein